MVKLVFVVVAVVRGGMLARVDVGEGVFGGRFLCVLFEFSWCVCHGISGAFWVLDGILLVFLLYCVWKVFT